MLDKFKQMLDDLNDVEMDELVKIVNDAQAARNKQRIKDAIEDFRIAAKYLYKLDPYYQFDGLFVHDEDDDYDDEPFILPLGILLDHIGY